jgi:uncharacterized protein YbjT (DUF2867 family)
MKIILTGATGMAGEGVLFECLQNDKIEMVLSISRRPYPMEHPKLRQLIIPDFNKLNDHLEEIKGFDTCFYCAGISSIGMKEAEFNHITYDTTISFAKALLEANGGIVFCYISGRRTDSSEKGKIMWARVKGKTENALMKLPFRAVYNFRPAAMYPFPGQKNWKSFYKFIVRVMMIFSRANIITLSELGKAMINASSKGYPSHILEVKDIKSLAKS